MRLDVNYSHHCPDSAVDWRATDLALQHRLGLFPEWRTWFGSADPAHSGSYGQVLRTKDEMGTSSSGLGSGANLQPISEDLARCPHHLFAGWVTNEVKVFDLQAVQRAG